MIIFTFLSAAGAALLVWMFAVEPRLREINRYEVSITKKLPRPLRILHLSDIHFARPDAALAKFFDRLAAEDFDAVLISGDIMDCKEGLPVCIENLKKLKPAHGIFAVFGNHDYFDYSFFDVILHNFPGQREPVSTQPTHLFASEMQAAGIRVMRNETLEINAGGAALLIHGLDDPTTGRANVRKAMQQFEPAKINILLTHTIDAFLDIGENEIDLSFSGHSHGGQIRLPFIGALLTHTMMGRAYAGGVMLVKGAVCSISRGVGASRMLWPRLLCRPEAIVLTVKTDDGTGRIRREK